MTTEQYLSHFEQSIQLVENPELIQEAVTTTHQMQATRIFERGEKATGGIGSYGTQPMYADQKRFTNGSAFKPAGKPGQKGNAKSDKKKLQAATAAGRFKNGKPRRSMYLQGGYRQLKSVQGLQASFVNLSNTDALHLDFMQSVVIAENGYITGVSSSENVRKIKGLLEKYGDDLFALSDDERNFFKTNVQQIVTNTLQFNPSSI